jgi:hypothetical protein
MRAQPTTRTPRQRVDHSGNGPAGPPVRLKISRRDQGDPIDVTMVREPILPAGARIEVRVEDGALAIAATGKWAIFNFEKGKDDLGSTDVKQRVPCRRRRSHSSCFRARRNRKYLRRSTQSGALANHGDEGELKYRRSPRSSSLCRSMSLGHLCDMPTSQPRHVLCRF